MLLAVLSANSAHLSGTREGLRVFIQNPLLGTGQDGHLGLGKGAGPSYMFRAHCLSRRVYWGELEIAHKTSGLFTITVPETTII